MTPGMELATITFFVTLTVMSLMILLTVLVGLHHRKQRWEGYKRRWEAMDENERMAWVRVIAKNPWVVGYGDNWEEYVVERYTRSRRG